MSANPASKRVHPAALRTFSLGFMVFLIWIAFAVRVIRLDELPLVLSMDESIDGLDALQLVRAGWLTPFLQNNFGRETLFLYIQGIALHLFGISNFALRFSSVAMGTLTVPLLYAVGRRLFARGMGKTEAFFSVHIGLLAATDIAVGYWHIYFSRLALRAIVLPPILLASMWCLWRARRLTTLSFSAGLPWWGIAGLLLGLALYTYTAARLLTLLFVLLIGVWLAQERNKRRQIGLGLAVFVGITAVVSSPLLVYFMHNPQAFGNRAAAISLPLDGTLWGTLGANLLRSSAIHFGGGSWVGHWPSLHALSGLGLFVGLLVCVRHFRRSPSWWLLTWWVVGFLPVWISRQDWEAVTTLLRGIVAWPAVYLVSAVGLVALTSWCLQHLNKQSGWVKLRRPWLAVLLALVLVFVGGLTDVRNYFIIWASNIAPSRDEARVLANYLNSRVGQLTLTPNRFYTATATRFLLQASYPILDSVSFEVAGALITAHRAHTAGEPAVTCILPHDGSTPSAWVLLEPRADGNGVAHLLPQLSEAQATNLAHAVRARRPLLTLFDNHGRGVADVYPLDPNTFPLPEKTETLQPLEAKFADGLLLLGSRVQPEQAKPGQQISLWLRWQSTHMMDGDYDLFIHLFNLQTGKRVAQVNRTLGSSILLHSHFWPPGLVVQDIHSFQLPSDAPEGVYRFEIGLYHRTSLARLPVIIAGQRAATDSVVLGKLLVQDAPPPPPTFDLLTSFENNILLRGLDLPTSSASDTLGIVLHWQATGVIAQDYTVFMHLLDEHTNLVAQQDNMPHQGRYPTSLWSPGEVVLDAYALSLPPQMRDGRYRLRIGLYDLPTGRRVRLLGQGQDYVEVMLQRLNGRFSLSGKGR
jgi:4-amino-4-deoxy-L-arabinose transferase-like glycosyltransferase